VVVLANAADPSSLAIARHYAERRGVPAANLIALPMPAEETVTWPVFVATVWRPLEAELVKRGWIDALPMNSEDAVGRRRYVVSGHRIGALVVCRGTPLRIDDDPALLQELPGLTDHPQFRTNRGAVDSELSLLPRDHYPITACIRNPLYENDHPQPAALASVVRVSRLDGPTADDAMHLVDRAIEAERTGLLGRAYVDIGGGPHPSGDTWLESTAAEIRQAGFDLSETVGKATLPAWSRFDAPALYFGWYAGDLNGPFALPGFRFPAGAVAVHIHSFSAHTLRSDTSGWCGPMVARGVTATLGNVFEPYLELTHRPDLFFRALARGDSLVEAAYYALPVLSWQSVVIGDPLYRPFLVSPAAAAAQAARLPADLAAYAVVREMNLLPNAAAEAAGRAELARSPSLEVAIALANRLAADGHAEEAASAVEDVAFAQAGPESGNWALLHEAALILSRCRHYPTAEGLYRQLLGEADLPEAVRLALLPDARQAAQAAGDQAQADAWAAPGGGRTP